MSLPIVTLLTLSVYMRTAAEAHGIWGSGGFAHFSAGIYATNYAAHPERAMQVNSKLFPPGGEFPKRETWAGRNSPATGLGRPLRSVTGCAFQPAR